MNTLFTFTTKGHNWKGVAIHYMKFQLKRLNDLLKAKETARKAFLEAGGVDKSVLTRIPGNIGPVPKMLAKHVGYTPKGASHPAEFPELREITPFIRSTICTFLYLHPMERAFKEMAQIRYELDQLAQ